MRICKRSFKVEIIEDCLDDQKSFEKKVLKLTAEKKKLEKDTHALRKQNEEDCERISAKYKKMLEEISGKYLLNENERKFEMTKFLNDKDFLIEKLKRGELTRKLESHPKHSRSRGPLDKATKRAPNGNPNGPNAERRTRAGSGPKPAAIGPKSATNGGPEHRNR